MNPVATGYRVISRPLLTQDNTTERGVKRWTPVWTRPGHNFHVRPLCILGSILVFMAIYWDTDKLIKIKVKVTLSLYHHVGAQGEMSYSFYSFLTSVVNRAALYSRERTSGTHWIGGWVGLSWSGHRG
jgi:hypothetical protein